MALLGYVPNIKGKYGIFSLASRVVRHRDNVYLGKEFIRRVTAETNEMNLVLASGFEKAYGEGVFEQLKPQTMIAKEYKLRWYDDHQFVLAASIIASENTNKVDHAWLQKVLDDYDLHHWALWVDMAFDVNDQGVETQAPAGVLLLKLLGIWPHDRYPKTYSIADIARHYQTKPDPTSALSDQQRDKAIKESHKKLSGTLRKAKDQALDEQWGTGFSKRFATQSGVGKAHGYNLLWSWAAAAHFHGIAISAEIEQNVLITNAIPDCGFDWAQGINGNPEALPC